MLTYYLKLATASLKRNRVLTALMVLTIAVGIAAAMTTLTIFRLLSADPLPERSAKLHYVQIDPSPKVSSREPWDLIDDRSAFDLYAARKATRQTLINEATVKISTVDARKPAKMLETVGTSADFFPMFAVPILAGRTWAETEDQQRAPLAVISTRLAREFFDNDAIGKQLQVNGQAVTVIGVLADWRPKPRFYDVAGGNFANGQTDWMYAPPQDVFLPFNTALDINAGKFEQFTCWGMPDKPGHLLGSPCVWIRLWVQLDTPADVARYREFLQSYAAAQKAAGRIGNADSTRLRPLMQWLDYNHAVPGDVGLQLWLAVAFLVLCLFNTVGLLLAKFLGRRAEFGVRRALGATRGDILRQCLTESGLVGLLGGALGFVGVLIGLWSIRQKSLGYADIVHLDWTMFLATFALALAAALLAGVLPALRASRVVPAIQLKSE